MDDNYANGDQAPATGSAVGEDRAVNYVIEITCFKDGGYSVSKEAGEMEAAEDGAVPAATEPEAEETPAKNWAEAMEIADQMHQAAEGSDGESQQAGFDQVFSGGAPAR